MAGHSPPSGSTGPAAVQVVDDEGTGVVGAVVGAVRGQMGVIVGQVRVAMCQFHNVRCRPDTQDGDHAKSPCISTCQGRDASVEKLWPSEYPALAKARLMACDGIAMSRQIWRSSIIRITRRQGPQARFSRLAKAGALAWVKGFVMRIAYPPWGTWQETRAAARTGRHKRRLITSIQSSAGLVRRLSFGSCSIQKLPGLRLPPLPILWAGGLRSARPAALCFRVPLSNGPEVHSYRNNARLTRL